MALGAAKKKVIVAGNLKFDVPAPARNALADWLAAQAERGKRMPVIVAGSVVANEENAVLDAFARVRERHPEALLVLAPRKPERFEAAAQLAEIRGWGMVRRSQLALNQPIEAETGILLLDTIGELGGLYAVADLVFVGGSLVPAGGHNILEPAALGKAPVFGPHMENFRSIAGRFLECHAAAQAATAEPDCVVTVHGADRMGIVHAVTEAVAACGASVVDLSTRAHGEGADAVYMMALEVHAGESRDAMREGLKAAAAKLQVDIAVHDIEESGL